MFYATLSLFLHLLLPPTQAPISLFDGRTFNGWEGDTLHTWQIKDGALTGGSLTTTVPHNEFLRTRRSYSDFVLELDFKLTGTEGFINGGVQFRSTRHTSPDYEMIGYQADIGKDYWGCLYDESRRNKVLVHADAAPLAKVLKLNDWNHYKIQCKGNHIQLWINGLKTVDYTEPDASIPKSGLIGLQIHGGGKALIQYKNIKITEL